jgi:indoleamine 2,3-dioxygenase
MANEQVVSLTNKFASNTYSDGIFNIGPNNGFLPVKDPLTKLPVEYTILQDILDNMPVTINLPDGSNKLVKFGKPGYLSEKNKLKEVVDSSLPNYLELIKQQVEENIDPFVIQALYRAYTFLASAYLLEPAYQIYKETGSYGKAHRFLPSNVSEPLFFVANKLKVAPYQDYHYSYSLCNYVRKDPNKGLTWDNLDMALRYSGTLDEVGFIMVHVDINANSPNLLSSINIVLTGIELNNYNLIIDGLQTNYTTMQIINERRKQMWKASDWKNYNSFRVFIMGSEGNTEIFGDGVVYENTFTYNDVYNTSVNNNQQDMPKLYRGQTGAQDDIIPTEDIFTGLINYYPNNMLTKYLLDLRRYRPVVVQEFFKDLGTDERIVNILDHISNITSCDGLTLLLAIVNEIYKFRNGHWQFVQKYIMANTKYAVATGGTPITSWIPNQLEATLLYMQTIMTKILDNNTFVDLNNKIIFDDLLSQHKLKCDTLELQIKTLNSAGIGLLTDIDFTKLNGKLAEN